jgi:glycosyltransferase involved in cell wall biosynthesis
VAETAEAFAAAVARLLGDPANRRALETQARRTAEERYGWDALARAQAALYARLAENRGQSAQTR